MNPSPSMPVATRDNLCVNTLRFLSVDAVQQANSGHPGLPLGAAPMAYVLWTGFLKHHPANPHWFDRDRFILSAGHGFGRCCTACCTCAATTYRWRSCSSFGNGAAARPAIRSAA